MNVREMIVKNLGWKLLALFLGILVWVFVEAGLRGEILFRIQRTASLTVERPVAVLAPAELGGMFEVEPPMVSVTVSGRRDALLELAETDVRVYVDLSDVLAAADVRRVVRVQPLGEVARVIVEPSTVRVYHVPAGGVRGE
jgi:YbbR domain-containing protein